jgi:large subunit ribosomal protein L9
MELILLEKVTNLGDIGARVHVRPGYAYNYLLPRRMAALATPENVARIEAERQELERRQAEIRARAEADREKLEGAVLDIEAQAGPEGRLFGSVGTHDIVEAIARQLSLTVHRRDVLLTQGQIREVGESQVEITLHADVKATVTVRVRAA